jgi:hypothetical protein
MTAEENLRDRLGPVLSAMLLYMNQAKLWEWGYKTTFPVMFHGIPMEYEISVTVRPKELIRS